MILLGVEELPDKTLHIAALPDPKKLLADFWNTVNNPEKVSVNILSEADVRVYDADGKRVIAIEVPRAQRGDKPVYVNNNPLSGTYRRNGEGNYHCAKAEVQATLRDAAIKTQDMLVLESAVRRLHALDGSHHLPLRRMEREPAQLDADKDVQSRQCRRAGRQRHPQHLCRVEDQGVG